MINSLYSFSPDSNVVADEWNANFRALQDNTNDCADAIVDANNEIAFPDSDLSGLFAAVKARPNSFGIPGTAITISPECEYYKTLLNGEDLSVQIPMNFNSEARIAIRILDDRTLLPFSVLYAGKKTNIDYGLYEIFNAGVYFILIYEIAGEQAFIKLIWTGE